MSCILVKCSPQVHYLYKKCPATMLFRLDTGIKLGLLQMQDKSQENKTEKTQLNANTWYSPPGPVTHLNLLMLSIQKRSKLQISPRGEASQNHVCPRAPLHNLSGQPSGQSPPVPARPPAQAGTVSRYHRQPVSQAAGRKPQMEEAARAPHPAALPPTTLSFFMTFQTSQGKSTNMQQYFDL